ncbi:MAG: hypothetical protein IPF62_08445 [Bacteroidetes bacterium]|nr:hypothetical protein [Bacteroidota bacterium]
MAVIVSTLSLNVFPNSTSNLIQTICQGESYLGYTITGVFIDTLINQSMGVIVSEH